eukprot:gene8496-biopygen6794
MHPTPNATPHHDAAGIRVHPQPGDELNAAIPTGNESFCDNSIDVEEHRSLSRLPRRCSPPHINVPPQPNFRPDSVFGTDRPASEALMPKSGP